MKTQDFQDFLFRSAITIIACDGIIDYVEIKEIKLIAENEIYFMGFDYEKALDTQLSIIKDKGIKAINDYLEDLKTIELNKKQELTLIEVLIRTIDSDNKVNSNEIKFLQLVISKLRINEETLIVKFPNKLSYFVEEELYNINFPNNIVIDIKPIQ